MVAFCFMAYYVYIIQSQISGDFYKGISQDVAKRVEHHNSGLSTFTKPFVPWVLVFVRSFPSKSEALKEELRLKKCNRSYLEWIIKQPFNLLNKS